MIRSYTKNVGTKEEPKYETRWEFIVRYINEDGIRKQKHLKNYKTENECRKAKSNFLQLMSKNTLRQGSNFEYIFNDYKLLWATYSPTTVRVNKHWFNVFILPYFKNYLVEDIKIKDVICFQNELRNKNLSDNSIKNITAQLKSFMNYCLANGYITHIPFYSRYTAVRVREKKDIVIWEMEEFAKFIKYYKDDIAKKAIFTLYFSTGLRTEELLGLQKKDFDSATNSIEIRRTYQFVEGKEYISTQMKTRGSKRTLFLPNYVANIIKEYIDSNNDMEDTDRLFPFKPRRISKWMDFGIAKTGVPRTTPHGLRHSFISNSLSKGLPITAVQKYAGHSTSRTTLDIYAHCCKKDERAVSILYDQAFMELEKHWQ